MATNSLKRNLILHESYMLYVDRINLLKTLKFKLEIKERVLGLYHMLVALDIRV
jgi:hypothetical protein